MKLNKILIICPTYKDSFNLKKALIDLNINWAYTKNGDIFNKEKWKKLWDTYKEKTMYCIENNKLFFSENCFFLEEEQESYSDYFIFNSVNEFIKKYIRYYEELPLSC